MKDFFNDTIGLIFKWVTAVLAFLNLWRAEQSARQENWGEATYFLIWGFALTAMFILFFLSDRNRKK